MSEMVVVPPVIRSLPDDDDNHKNDGQTPEKEKLFEERREGEHSVGLSVCQTMKVSPMPALMVRLNINIKE